jgi:phosphatidylglycerol---prolipoprotein diacylglyceryl transferase
MFPTLQIGPLAMQTPGLILLLGLWFGLSLSEKFAPRFQTNSNDIYNLVFMALLSGLVGARLSFVAQFPDAFLSSPLSLVSLNPGLLDPLGGGLIGLIAGVVYANRKGYSLWPTLDALTPLMAVFSLAIGLSHLASGDAFGVATELPWGIDLWGEKRHPSQVYESILAALILGDVWSRTKTTSQWAGGTFWRFLSLSAGARLLLEGLRADSQVLPNGLRVAQLVAWVVLAVSLWMLEQRNSPKSET